MAAKVQLSPAETTEKAAEVTVREDITAINIGAQYGRWIDLKNDLQCGNDTLAKLLLDIWYEFKDEDLPTKCSSYSESRSRSRVHHASSTRPEDNVTDCPPPQDSHDAGSWSPGADNTAVDDDDTTYARKSSRRKPPKSHVSRYLEDNNNSENPAGGDAKVALVDYLSGRMKLERADSMDSERSRSRSPRDEHRHEDPDTDDEFVEEGEVDEDEEDEEEENEFLSGEEIEKILKGSESESDSEQEKKKKKDSDSDWIPSYGEERTARRTSRRLSKRGGAGRVKAVSHKRSSTTTDDSSDDEEVEVEEEVEGKSPRRRGRPKKITKGEDGRSRKPRLLRRDGGFQCSVCESTHSKKSEGERHLQTHYDFGCSMCMNRFYSERLLEHHQTKKHPVCQTCIHCGFKARSRLDLKRHMRKQHKVEQDLPGTTLCHVCGQQFRYVTNVQKHLLEVHGIVESSLKSYMCDKCGNEYYLKHSLRKHLLTHKEKTILCEFDGCTSRFSWDAQYKRHYDTVHLKIKRHSCPYDDCDMKFAFRKTMVAHVNMVHLKLRLFPCTWQGCERSFYAKKHLTVHLRIHNNEKPFECSQCDYRCRQRAALNWHLKKHGITPDHPESLENEKKRMKDGFPVNFKRGRKRTRFRKSRGVDYTDDQIASINQRYRQMVTAAVEVTQVIEENSGDVPPQLQSPKQETESEQMVTEGNTSKDSQEEINKTSPQIDGQMTLKNVGTDQMYDQHGLLSTATETAKENSELRARLEYKPLQSAQSPYMKTPLREGDLAFQQSREPSYHHPVHHSEFQPSRETHFAAVRDGGFEAIRNPYVAEKESSFHHLREGNYPQIHDVPMEYQGYTMKENMNNNSCGGFPRFLSKDMFSNSHKDGLLPARSPFKDAYMAEHPMPEPALRSLPHSFQGQMEVSPQYDPRSPIHSAMGSNSIDYGHDLNAYSRDYK